MLFGICVRVDEDSVQDLVFLKLCVCVLLPCVHIQENSQGFIRVQAPQFSKVSMAIQLTEELQADDVLTRFLTQER